jgi:hypothetical protein
MSFYKKIACTHQRAYAGYQANLKNQEQWCFRQVMPRISSYARRKYNRNTFEKQMFSQKYF